MRRVFEPSNTVQFTLSMSLSPDSAPRFAILNSSDTLVSSMTSASSDATHYYSLVTMPVLEGAYIGEWLAVKTFQGSARNFLKRFAFNVSKTRAN